jgi:two-component system response regulator HydG
MEATSYHRDRSEDAAPSWNLLISTDEAALFDSLREALPAQVRLVDAPTPSKAMRCLEEEAFHALVIAPRQITPGIIDFLGQAMTQDDSLPVILYLERREQLDRLGIHIRPLTWTVLIRPQPIEHIRVILMTTLDRIRLQREVQYLRHREPYIYRFDRIVGKSAQIQDVLRLVGKVADSDATVLIQGESGTGKELIAAGIHFNSPRKDAPFVTVNCAALQENLLESELFGHEKGAFTGAERQRIGRFEQANGGSLFLDEVGDMSPGIQAKVLRVLQERSFERLGGSKTLRVNVRILAATNKDLRKAIQENAFRDDLYFRLSVVPIHLPPLRDRPEDIQPLAEFFLRKYRAEKSRPEGFQQEALDLLLSYPWPGNIRELENVVERAVLICRQALVSPEDLMLPAVPTEGASAAQVVLPPGGVDLEEVEQQLILQALQRTHGVQKKAAQLLRISARAMHYKIRKHKIRLPLQRA